MKISSHQWYRKSLEVICTEDMLKVYHSNDIIRCGDFDTIEELGINLAKKLFDIPFANIQSTSGTVSNIAALKALSKPGDNITAVSTATVVTYFDARMGAVGLRDLNLSTYPWDEERMEPDIDASAKLIREIKPKVALFGQSVFFSLRLWKN